MKKKTKLEEILDEDVTQDNGTGNDNVSFKDEYEEIFRHWLDSDVELHQATRPFRYKFVRDFAQAAVNYFVRSSELGRPLTLSGAVLAMDFNGYTGLDLYCTYHPEFASLVDKIKFICEQYAESMLFSKVSSGAKFVLMNRNKWSNREVSEVTNHNIDVTIGNSGSQL